MSLLDRIKSLFSKEPPPPGDERQSGTQPAAPDAVGREPTPAEAAAAAAAQPVTAPVDAVSSDAPSDADVRSAEQPGETGEEAPEAWAPPPSESGDPQGR